MSWDDFLQNFKAIWTNSEVRIFYMGEDVTKQTMLNNMGYLVLNVHSKAFAIHRAMALKYVANPQIGVYDVVNHIDGNKLNFHPNNLEWCTKAMNNDHAYRSGLRDDNIPLKVWNIDTRETLTYYSLSETARQLNVTVSRISKYLKSKRNALFDLRYVIARVDDPNWDKLITVNPNVSRNGMPRVIIVTDINQNVDLKFRSLSQASKAISVDKATICTYLKKGKIYKNKYSFRYIDELPDFDKDVSPNFKRTPQRVRVMNNNTDEISLWTSLEEFANSINANKSNIQKAIHVDGNWHQYTIVYLN